MIASIIYRPNVISSFPSSYSEPNEQDFILSNRRFIENGELKDIAHTLIINTCPVGSISDNIKMINFNKVLIDNVGFGAVYIEIESIEIYRNLGEPIIIKPKDSLNKIIERIDSNELGVEQAPIEIYISMITNTEAGIYDFPKMNNENYNINKIMETGGELLESTLEKENVADLWNKLKLNIITKNIYGEAYKQTLEIKIQDNGTSCTYLSTQTVPKFIKLKEQNEDK